MQRLGPHCHQALLLREMQQFCMQAQQDSTCHMLIVSSGVESWHLCVSDIPGKATVCLHAMKLLLLHKVPEGTAAFDLLEQLLLWTR